MHHTYRTSTALSLAFFTLTFAGCNNLDGNVTNNNTGTGGSISVASDDITSIGDLVTFLQSEGHAVSVGQRISQPYFTAMATEVLVDNMPILVFEYATEEDAEAAVNTISTDGTMINNNNVSWVEEPHFYQEGRLIALYVGTNETMLDTLEDTLGAQVAGGSTDDEDIRTDDTDTMPNAGTGGLMMNDSF